MSKTVDVIVLIGQSNMEGYSLPCYLSKDKQKEYLKGFNNIKMCYECNWTNLSFDFVPVTLGQGFNDGKLRFGPEIGIAEEITKQKPNKELYIIKYTLGGTRFKEHWNINNGFCYYYFKKHLKYSVDLLLTKGLTPNIRAVIFMQGESDSIEQEDVLHYEEREFALINDVFALIKPYRDDKSIFLDCGVLDITDCFPLYKETNKAKINNAKKDPRIVYLSTIDLKMTATKERPEEVDFAHYDSESMIVFGKKIADVLMEKGLLD